ncbi:TPA: 1-deoxy-D-xylulose-5-phosphate synthase [bacterium]|nr:1-deoxy-D-xylulose-5-phosphate synthase [bacterium]
MILDRIDSPDDLKRLSINELIQLIQELRAQIVEVVAKNGGHLASNLGVVELTIALHYVLNPPQDVIVWDVGHQCYAHKLLTGRRRSFVTLRQDGGIAGFPRREESVYDAFNTGHASTAISAALGMALARDLRGEEGVIVAVVGDGSLSGGMAFEALNHAGHLKKDLLVILNSNEMSISPSVGALSSYLNRLLTMPVYNRARQDIEALLKRVPRVGPKMVTLKRRVEEAVKHLLIPGALFEELGFRYFGPIDGHNLSNLIETIKRVKEMKEPRLIHVVTKKGKGYLPAEENPSWFHGSGPFDPTTGKPMPSTDPPTYSEAFGEVMVELGREDPRIVAITAAMAEGTGLDAFQKSFPNRFFDVGIAEEHAVTMAAGMAVKGLRPVVAIYSTFLQRAYDQILHDVCLQNLPVIFAIDRAGVVGEDGPTHHGVFDIAYLRHIPGIVIMVPKDEMEFRAMIKLALSLERPVAIRYPRGRGLGVILEKKIELGKAEILREGRDGTILAIGRMVYPALDVAEELSVEGIEIGMVNARFVKPLDEDLILSISKEKPVVTIEEHVCAGGFGSAVMELLARNNIRTAVKSIGLPDRFIEHADITALHRRYHLDKDGIWQELSTFFKRKD